MKISQAISRRKLKSTAMQNLRPVPRVSIQAFCVSDGVAKPIERMAADRRMAKTHMRVHMGGVDTALEFYQTAPTPNLILLESAAEPRGLIEQLESLASVCDPNTKVVVIGHYNDVTLYRELVRAGVSEYMVAPISVADTIAVISGIFIDPEASAHWSLHRLHRCQGRCWLLDIGAQCWLDDFQHVPERSHHCRP